MPVMTPGALSLVFADDDASTWLPVQAVDADLEGTRYMSGAGSVIVPSSSELVSLFMGSTVAEEFANCSLRAFYRDPTEPLWSGPATGARLRSTGDSGYVEIAIEQFWGHFLRRRQLLETALADVSYALASTYADNLALDIMKKQIGPTPTTPATYPLAVLRDDFGPFTPTVAAAHSPALSSSRPASREQSGTCLLDWFEDFAEQEDLAAVMSDPLDQTFELDTDYPFEGSDVSAAVRFGQWYGNLAEFEVVNDYRSLANVWCVEGGNTTTHSFTSDGTSITVWGVTEARAQKPQGTADANDVSAAATWLKDRHSGGTITYRAQIIESPGCLFNDDWSQRDRVAIEEAVYGVNFTQVVAEWKLKASDGGEPQFDFLMGDTRADLTRWLAAYVGSRGPRAGGGRWRNKRN